MLDVLHAQGEADADAEGAVIVDVEDGEPVPHHAARTDREGGGGETVGGREGDGRRSGDGSRESRPPSHRGPLTNGRASIVADMDSAVTARGRAAGAAKPAAVRASAARQVTVESFIASEL